jgi:hypothetical protein
MSFFRRTIPDQNYPADRTAYTAAKNVCCTLNNPSIRLKWLDGYNIYQQKHFFKLRIFVSHKSDEVF